MEKLSCTCSIEDHGMGHGQDCPVGIWNMIKSVNHMCERLVGYGVPSSALEPIKEWLLQQRRGIIYTASRNKIAETICASDVPRGMDIDDLIIEKKYFKEWPENTEIPWWNDGRTQLNKIIRVINEWTSAGCSSYEVGGLCRLIDNGTGSFASVDGGGGWQEELSELKSYVLLFQ